MLVLAFLLQAGEQEGDAAIGFHEDGRTQQLAHAFFGHAEHESGLTLLRDLRQTGQAGVFRIAPLVEQRAAIVGEQSHHMIGNHRVDDLQVVGFGLGQIALRVLVITRPNRLVALV